MFIVGNEMSSRPTLDGTRDVKRAEEKKKKKKKEIWESYGDPLQMVITESFCENSNLK